MTMINGPRLRLEPLLKRGKSNTDFGDLRGAGRPSFICPHRGCGKGFHRYPGMKLLGSGVARCQEHEIKVAA